MKKTLKSVVGRAMFRSGFHRKFLKNTAVVSAFHRIEDQQIFDPITVGVSDFSSFCEKVGKHFTVISLTELIDRLENGLDISNCMVITFDDGYEDNYSTAAEILRKHELPATFFVATDFIGTNEQPYWDRNHGVKTRWMTWTQVRELHAMGFEIGAHTRTHPNLATLSEYEAAEEIRGSQDALQNALGAEVRLFSYPFGGKDQCTDAVRKLVAGMGFRCCLSCHGGLVRPGDDPLRLQRLPVNKWFSSYWDLATDIVRDARLSA